MSKKKGFIVFLVAVVIGFGVAYFGVQTDFWGIFAKPGSCLVLPEKYCKTGVDFEEGSSLVAFKLPNWTPIFAPFDGEVLDADTSNLSGRAQQGVFMEYYANSTADQSGSMNFFMTGDYRLKEKLGSSVKKGDKMVRISQPKGETKGTSFNLLVSFGEYDDTIRLFVPTLEMTKKILGL
jgi:hypothetical protein